MNFDLLPDSFAEFLISSPCHMRSPFKQRYYLKDTYPARGRKGEAVTVNEFRAGELSVTCVKSGLLFWINPERIEHHDYAGRSILVDWPNTFVSHSNFLDAGFVRCEIVNVPLDLFFREYQQSVLSSHSSALSKSVVSQANNERAANPENTPLTITLEDGRIFPVYNGKTLSWNLSLTWTDERAGFPELRAVIRAMMVHRPDQLQNERRDLLKHSFDRMFGQNARKVLDVIEDCLKRAANGENPLLAIAARYRLLPNGGPVLSSHSNGLIEDGYRDVANFDSKIQAVKALKDAGFYVAYPGKIPGWKLRRES